MYSENKAQLNKLSCRLVVLSFFANQEAYQQSIGNGRPEVTSLLLL